MSGKKDDSKLFIIAIKGKFFPVLIGIILCTLVTGLWTALENQEDANRIKTVKTEAQKIVEIINIDLNNRIKSLQRIIKRWEIRGGTPRNEFISDTEAYIAHDPGYQALSWVDKSFHVRWIIPFIGNEAALNLNLAFEENRRIALEKAKNRKVPTLTSPIELVQGGKGFLVYFPIFVNGEFEGFLSAVFRTQEWLNYILHENLSPKEELDFRNLVLMDDQKIYSTMGWDNQKESPWAAVVETEIFGHRFLIRSHPTEPLISQSHSLLPELVFYAGILLSLLISLIVHLIQKANNAIKTTLASKIALENEITVRKKIEVSLKKERQRLTYILAGTNVGTWEWEVQTGATIINERWANIVGYTMEELAPVSINTWLKLLHPDDLKVSNELLEKHFNGKLDYYECESRMRHKDGHWVWVLDRGKTSIWSEERKPLFMAGTHTDISRQKHIEEKIRHLATHDALTDLPSLRLANDRLSMAITVSKRKQTLAAAMFVDLDGFKSINDTHGHDAGDALLQEVAKRLISCVRATDTVARIGGDEFLLIITDFESKDVARSIAEKTIKIVSQPVPFKRLQLTVGASVGIAVFPVDSDSADNLIKKADEAMYVSKNSGKNRYTFAKVQMG